MNVLGSHVKNFEKNCSIFSKEELKESHKNTDQKVSLRQGDILKF
jgi:hypothetical protein